MKPESRSNAYALMGIAALVLGGYAFRQTIRYVGISGDTLGAGLFGLAGIGLVTVAVAHIYMAAGYRFGRLESVTGSLNTATLRTRSGVVAESVRIRLLRKPDAGNSGSKTNHHFVFFIGNCRPWVCPESSFLKE